MAQPLPVVGHAIGGYKNKLRGNIGVYRVLAYSHLIYRVK